MRPQGTLADKLTFGLILIPWSAFVLFSWINILCTYATKDRPVRVRVAIWLAWLTSVLLLFVLMAIIGKQLSAFLCRVVPWARG